MSFVDKATVVLRAGDGGDGVVSFRHEKFVDRGGPDGGDGGKGGDIVFEASRNQNTLASFRYQKELAAESGGNGTKQRRHGKNGSDLLIKVPLGTVVVDEDGVVLADLTSDHQQAIIARGGQGGFGNAHFVSSRRQAPKIAEKGEPGEVIEARLELKIIADVGLVGLPNAGKSTLLSVISNARPEIADYPFTTIKPNLGVVDLDDNDSLLVADIPGLIAGAASGKGLGDEFLRHVERTALLLHLIDAYQEDIAAAYQTITQELASYKLDLTAKPQLIALTKTEGLDADMLADQIARLRSVAPKDSTIVAISAQAKQGLPVLLHQLAAMVRCVRQEQQEQAATAEATTATPVITLAASDDTWTVVKNDSGYSVMGVKIERFSRRTDFASEEGVARLRNIMQRTGIMHELARQGIQPGDIITIGHQGSLTY